MGSCGSSLRPRRHHSRQGEQVVHPPPSDPRLTGNRYIVAAATPYPVRHPNSNPNSQYYPGYYPMPQLPDPRIPYPSQSPFPYNGGANWANANGQYPYCSVQPHVVPYVEHQKALTIRNDVNVKKESLHVEVDEKNPGKSLISFKFDATAPGRITVIFFAKEGTDCNLMSMKESLIEPVTITFQQGLGQSFGQPSGSGIDFSLFDELELTKEGGLEVYPLAIRADAYPLNNGGSASNQSGNSQITFAVFERKEKGEYQVRVKEQIFWVNGMRYELQEIYGIRDAVDGEFEGNETGKECIICLSEPRNTTVLPCRHLCMCSECAKVLRFKTTRCPICRRPVEQLLEIEVTTEAES